MERLNMLLRRFMVSLTADRRKFGVFCALLTLGLLFWARIIVIKNLPRTVMADDEPAALLTDGGGDAASASDKNGLQVRSISLDLQPERDPFLLNEAYFPKSEKPASDSTEARKSAPSSSEEPEQAISRLQLEAVMQGNPMAVISGRTYRPGDWIETGGTESVQFMLIEVRRRSVVLEHAGRHFELRLDGSRG
ncbi:MAG: hypothetical protein VX727_06700 [Planctomycetota bacterium]|nr:hypothetical protein [Planctomycetota bacterium]